jgi:hypothetical protein
MKRGSAFDGWGSHRNHDEPAFVPADPRWATDVRGRPRGPPGPHGATPAEIEELRRRIPASSPDMAILINLTRTG